MASKFQRASALSKNSTMLTNIKINNVYPMKKNFYSASPGGKKTGGTNFKLSSFGTCEGRTEVGNTEVRSVLQTTMSTGTHRRPMAATYLFTSYQ